ncbi:MAG: hypothetical protein ACXQTS_04140 [Candidatus Methanospirareceae archaeon]
MYYADIDIIFWGLGFVLYFLSFFFAFALMFFIGPLETIWFPFPPENWIIGYAFYIMGLAMTIYLGINLGEQYLHDLEHAYIFLMTYILLLFAVFMCTIAMVFFILAFITEE